jgi:hypothetical protein
MNPDAPVRRRDRATWRDITVAATLAVLIGVAAGYLLADYRSRQESTQQLDACQRFAASLQEQPRAGGPKYSVSALGNLSRCMEHYDENYPLDQD